MLHCNHSFRGDKYHKYSSYKCFKADFLSRIQCYTQRWIVTSGHRLAEFTHAIILSKYCFTRSMLKSHTEFLLEHRTNDRRLFYKENLLWRQIPLRRRLFSKSDARLPFHPPSARRRERIYRAGAVSVNVVEGCGPWKNRDTPQANPGITFSPADGVGLGQLRDATFVGRKPAGGSARALCRDKRPR